jgi:hypothetical protein
MINMVIPLSEVVTEQIAQTLHLPVDEVSSVIQAAVADDNQIDALTTLWRAVYLQAVQGNIEAQGLALRMFQFRAELVARAATMSPIALPAPPVDAPPAAASIRNAYAILAGNAGHVAQVLVDIAKFSTNDGTRVTAAVAILDRVGISRVERSEVAVHLLDASVAAGQTVQGSTTAATLVRQRLHAIAARHQADPEIVDADPSAD